MLYIPLKTWQWRALAGVVKRRKGVMKACLNSHFCFQPQATCHVKTTFHTADAYKFHKSSQNIVTVVENKGEEANTSSSITHYCDTKLRQHLMWANTDLLSRNSPHVTILKDLLSCKQDHHVCLSWSQINRPHYIHFIIILSSMARFSTCSLSSRFPHQNSVRISLLLHRGDTYPAHHIAPNFINRIFGKKYSSWRSSLWKPLISPPYI
jgi:hypothetical protein